jgi:hypothetical protein
MIRLRSPNKSKPAKGKVVWRISAAAPLGAYEQLPAGALPMVGEPATTARASGLEPDGAESPREIPERGFHHSSHELASGVEMIEEPPDSIPGELFDAFFKKA